MSSVRGLAPTAAIGAFVSPSLRVPYGRSTGREPGDKACHVSCVLRLPAPAPYVRGLAPAALIRAFVSTGFRVLCGQSTGHDQSTGREPCDKVCHDSCVLRVPRLKQYVRGLAPTAPIGAFVLPSLRVPHGQSTGREPGDEVYQVSWVLRLPAPAPYVRGLAPTALMGTGRLVLSVDSA